VDLFALAAKLFLDKSEYDKGLDDAEKSTSSFADKLKSGLGAAAKVGAAALTTAATAAGALTTAIVQGAGEAAAYGDNIDKASQKLGISAEAYQEWEAVLQHSGTSMDAMSVGMKTLSQKAAEGSDVFKKLGISQKQAASMSREDLFNATITALQGVQDENARAQMAQELFGKSAMELGPLLNTSAADTKAMKDRVHELGGVMSNDAVKAAAAYQDSLQDMQTAMDGAKRNIISEFLPSLTTVMDGITDLFTGGGVEKISQGIGQFVDKIAETVPKVVEKGSQIALALGDAVIQNLPVLMGAATQLVMTLGTGIVEQLPMMLDAGLQVILAFAQSISGSLPELIPTVVETVLTIVNTLTDPNTLSGLIDAAVQIIIALAEGLINALPRLIERAPEIVANLCVALITAAPKLLEAAVKLVETLATGIIQNAGQAVKAITDMFGILSTTVGDLAKGAWEWGKDLILNFWEGLKAFVSKPIDTIKDLAGKIKSFLGFSEPEEGPLSNFHTYAPDMMALFAKGITDNEKLVTDAIGEAFDFGRKTAPAANPSAGQETTVQRVNENTRPINVIFELNGVQRWIYRLNKAEEQRVGVTLSGGMA